MKKILFRTKPSSDSDGRSTTTGMKKQKNKNKKSSSNSNAYTNSNSRIAAKYLGGVGGDASFSERSERTVSTTASSRSSASFLYPLSPSASFSPSPLVVDAEEDPRRRHRRRASIQFGGDTTTTSIIDTHNCTDLALSFPTSPYPSSSSSPTSSKGSSRVNKLKSIKKKQQQEQQQCRRSSMPTISIPKTEETLNAFQDTKNNNKSPISQLEQDARHDFNLYCYGGCLDDDNDNNEKGPLLTATATTTTSCTSSATNNCAGTSSPEKEDVESVVEEEEEDFKAAYEYEDISVRGYHQRSIVDIDDENNSPDYQGIDGNVEDVQIPLNDSVDDTKSRLKLGIMKQYGYDDDKNDDEDDDIDDHSSCTVETDDHCSTTSLDLRSKSGTHSYSFDEWTTRRCRTRPRRRSVKQKKSDDSIDNSGKQPSSRRQRRASMGEIYDPSTTSATYCFDGTRQPRRSSMKQSTSSTSSDDDDDGSKRRQRRSSMGEEIEVYLPKEGRTVRRRSSITFGTDDVVEVQPAKELTDDPQSLHYRKQELKVFKQKIADQAAANKGQSKLLSRVLKVKKRHCTRGIERFVDTKTRMEWVERKTTAWNVVLGVQGIQQSIGDYDANNLADVYKQVVSQDPQKEAMERAMKDAKAAKRYLRSTRRACRRASM